MAKGFSRFFRGGFIAVICAALQSQVFAFPVQLNNKGLVNGTVSMSKSSGVEGTDVVAFLESSASSATISAQANAGYAFEKWTVSITYSSGTKTSTVTDNPYKITYSDFDSKYGADDILMVQCTPTFKGKVIKVNLNANNSNAAVNPTVISVTVGGKYSALSSAQVTAKGASFVGWFTTSSGGTKITGDTVVTQTGEHTLYAHWQALSYNLVFDPSGGTLSGSSSLTVIYGDVYPDLPIASRTGYDFQGWYTGENGTGSQIKKGGEVAILNDSTLYAYWSPKNYTVSFNANGGSVATSSKSVTYNSTYGDLPTPSRTGYSFSGWYTATSGGTKITSSTKVQITSAQTLYARWSAKTYTVTFNSNGGSVDPTSKSVTYNSTYGDFPTPTRVGYTFTGWYTATSGGTQVTSTTKVQITAAQTLYAQWTANKYTVEYDANGGNVGTSSKQVTYDATYGALSTPTRTGYTFKGWYTEASGGAEVTSSTKVQIVATQILYAHWAANESTVEFDANGGTVTTTSKNVTYDLTYGDLPIPTLTGYDFKGWYTGLYGGTRITSSTVVKITGDQTLYAQWTPKTYTVYLNPNGGGVSAFSISVTYDSQYDDLQKAERPGYDFDGWFTESSGGTEITSSTKVQITEDQTLYAKWTPKTYTVTFNANGGNVDKRSKVVTYDSAYGDLPIPTPPNEVYAFNGWFTEASGGVEITASTIVQITSDQTLYAQWSKLSYTVSFDRAGGEFVGDGFPISVENGETYPALPEVTRVGYGFAGWYLPGEVEIKEGYIVTITSNSWAYAVWTNNIYTVTFRKGEAFYGEEFSTNVFHDIPFELPKNSFECLDGSTFAGWRLPDGSLSSENTIVSNLATSGSVEIIATWGKLTDEFNTSGVCKDMFITGPFSGDQAWRCISLDGEKCLASGDAKGGRSVLQARVVGASGRITFKWRYVGNSTIKKYFYPGGEGLANNYKELIDSDDPEGVWMEVAWLITADMIRRSGGEILWGVNKAIGEHASETHTLYIKDVVWIPDGYTENDECVTFTYEDNDGVERTASVPKSWVDENNLLPTGSEDYKAALEASSGKIGSNGAALPYWYDYVAGTNPNDLNDIFRITSISVTNGTVFLTWRPDLSSDALAREYKVLGKASLSDPDETWAPTNSASRFFRVDVHLKK